MKKFGFDNTHVLMVGDAPGDLDAARKMVYSIIQFLLEKKNSHGIVSKMKHLGKFLDGSFEGEYQQQLIEEFNSNLK